MKKKNITGVIPNKLVKDAPQEMLFWVQKQSVPVVLVSDGKALLVTSYYLPYFTESEVTEKSYFLCFKKQGHRLIYIQQSSDNLVLFTTDRSFLKTIDLDFFYSTEVDMDISYYEHLIHAVEQGNPEVTQKPKPQHSFYAFDLGQTVAEMKHEDFGYVPITSVYLMEGDNLVVPYHTMLYKEVSDLPIGEDNEVIPYILLRYISSGNEGAYYITFADQRIFCTGISYLSKERSSVLDGIRKITYPVSILRVGDGEVALIEEDTPEEILAKLYALRDQAVEAEDYDEAAKIRDEIDKIQNN